MKIKPIERWYSLDDGEWPDPNVYIICKPSLETEETRTTYCTILEYMNKNKIYCASGDFYVKYWRYENSAFKENGLYL